jgi:putative two-component system response regulator
MQLVRNEYDSTLAEWGLGEPDWRATLREEREKSLQLLALSRALEAALESERKTPQESEWERHETILRLMLTRRFLDVETGSHICRVGRYSAAVGRHLNLSSEQASEIAAAALMHDVGKVGLPPAILQKPGGLTDQERRRMETHTTIGAELLGESSSPLVRTACAIAMTHHERWDGTGYPLRLKREEIPLAGRIVMLADQYDALRSARCYKPAFSHGRTAETILRGDGRTRPEHFDPQLLDAFRALEKEFDAVYESSRLVAAV